MSITIPLPDKPSQIGWAGVQQRMRQFEEPHLVTVTFLAPGHSAYDAGQKVYNRLQDTGFDEENWAFNVNKAASLNSYPVPLIGLDSGEIDGIDLLQEASYD